jgi:hypothetical protein
VSPILVGQLNQIFGSFHMTKGTTLVEVRQAFPGIGFPVKFNSMSKNRLEAFSDGVLAILITIMVLELKVPHSEMIYDLIPLAPIFFELCH